MIQNKQLLSAELETLVETFKQRYGMDINDIIRRVNDKDYPEEKLIEDLEINKLKHFASKIRKGYYG